MLIPTVLRMIAFIPRTVDVGRTSKVALSLTSIGVVVVARDRITGTSLRNVTAVTLALVIVFASAVLTRRLAIVAAVAFVMAPAMVEIALWVITEAGRVVVSLRTKV